jgi:hypothetical protein
MITNRVETTTKLSALAKGLEMNKVLESVTLEICQALNQKCLNQTCLIQGLT